MFAHSEIYCSSCSIYVINLAIIFSDMVHWCPDPRENIEAKHGDSIARPNLSFGDVVNNFTNSQIIIAHKSIDRDVDWITTVPPRCACIGNCWQNKLRCTFATVTRNHSADTFYIAPELGRTLLWPFASFWSLACFLARSLSRWSPLVIVLACAPGFGFVSSCGVGCGLVLQR